VSTDGGVTVGHKGFGLAGQAVAWPSTGGEILLGNDSPENLSFNEAYAISADGSVVVGQGEGRAVRWTAATGTVGVGPVSGPVSSNAQGISADGTVVVGWHTDGAFRWSVSDGFLILGPGEAEDASGDGSVVVGGSNGEAFFWDAIGGWRPLEDVLVDDYGLDVTGWELSGAFGISDSGLTIVGTGTNPSGDKEGWIAVIPEPTTALLLASGLAVLGAGRAARASWQDPRHSGIATEGAAGGGTSFRMISMVTPKAARPNDSQR
jgi:uncharacterized membrane protein